MNGKIARLYRQVAKLERNYADPLDRDEAEAKKYKQLKRADSLMPSGKERAAFRASARSFLKNVTGKAEQ